MDRDTIAAAVKVVTDHMATKKYLGDLRMLRRVRDDIQALADKPDREQQ